MSDYSDLLGIDMTKDAGHNTAVPVRTRHVIRNRVRGKIPDLNREQAQDKHLSVPHADVQDCRSFDDGVPESDAEYDMEKEV